jgi:hypothetical protein
MPNVEIDSGISERFWFQKVSLVSRLESWLDSRLSSNCTSVDIMTFANLQPLHLFIASSPSILSSPSKTKRSHTSPHHPNQTSSKTSLKRLRKAKENLRIITSINPIYLHYESKCLLSKHKKREKREILVHFTASRAKASVMRSRRAICLCLRFIRDFHLNFICQS